MSWLRPLSQIVCLFLDGRHVSLLVCLSVLVFRQVVSEVMSRDLKMEVDDELLQAAKH